MKVALDGYMATAVKRQHEPKRVVGDRLMAEISEKKARSIRYPPAAGRQNTAEPARCELDPDRPSM